MGMNEGRTWEGRRQGERADLEQEVDTLPFQSKGKEVRVGVIYCGEGQRVEGGGIGWAQ